MKYLAATVCVLVLVFTNCGESAGQKTLSFENGRKLEVQYELSENDIGEKVFVLDYKNPKAVLELEAVEKDVLRIWSHLKPEADRLESEEAVIKYEYTTDPEDVAGERHFESLLFAGDKTESGEWTIKRVN